MFLKKRLSLLIVLIVLLFSYLLNMLFFIKKNENFLLENKKNESYKLIVNTSLKSKKNLLVNLTKLTDSFNRIFYAKKSLQASFNLLRANDFFILSENDKNLLRDFFNPILRFQESSPSRGMFLRTLAEIGDNRAKTPQKNEDFLRLSEFYINWKHYIGYKKNEKLSWTIFKKQYFKLTNQNDFLLESLLVYDIIKLLQTYHIKDFFLQTKHLTVNTFFPKKEYFIRLKMSNKGRYYYLSKQIVFTTDNYLISLPFKDSNILPMGLFASIMYPNIKRKETDQLVNQANVIGMNLKIIKF